MKKEAIYMTLSGWNLTFETVLQFFFFFYARDTCRAYRTLKRFYRAHTINQGVSCSEQQ